MPLSTTTKSMSLHDGCVWGERWVKQEYLTYTEGRAKARAFGCKGIEQGCLKN